MFQVCSTLENLFLHLYKVSDKALSAKPAVLKFCFLYSQRKNKAEVGILSADFETEEAQEQTTTCDSRTRYKILTDTIFLSHEVSFHLNETVFDKTMDGRSIKMVVTQSHPNQWIEIQTSLTNGKETKLIRTFTPSQMYVQMRVGNVESSSAFLRNRNAASEVADLDDW